MKEVTHPKELHSALNTYKVIKYKVIREFFDKDVIEDVMNFIVEVEPCDFTLFVRPELWEYMKNWDYYDWETHAEMMYNFGFGFIRGHRIVPSVECLPNTVYVCELPEDYVCIGYEDGELSAW